MVGRCPAQSLCHPVESFLISEEHQQGHRCDLQQINVMAGVITNSFLRSFPHFFFHLSSFPTCDFYGTFKIAFMEYSLFAFIFQFSSPDISFF
jgi:hypothetical protein